MFMITYPPLFQLDSSLAGYLHKVVKMAPKPLTSKRIRHNEKKAALRKQQQQVTVSKGEESSDEEEEETVSEEDHILDIDSVTNRFSLLTT